MKQKSNIKGVLAIDISVVFEEFTKKLYKGYKKDFTPEEFEKEMIKALMKYTHDLEDPKIKYNLKNTLK